jgi:hypothetical protein
MRFRGIVFCAIAFLALALSVLVLLQAAASTARPPVNLSSSLPPADAQSPPSAEGDGNKMLPYFDDYSWRAFIAMVWPAAAGQRGMPDNRQTVASRNQPKVFETLKASWEIFHANSSGQLDGSEPIDWSYYDRKQYNACSVDMHFGDLVLASFSKFTDIGQAGYGTLDPSLCGGRCGPLLARNGTFLHYLTGYNQVVFQQIKAQQLYLRVSPVSFQSSLTPGQNALIVKSAWMEMANFDARQAARYYTRQASVLDPFKRTCSVKTVGLVGLHIAQRTLNRTQWIWTTFEQVDNIPPPDPLGSDGTFALYKQGAPTLPPDRNPYPLDLTPTTPLVFRNVRRLQPIQASTQATNLDYRKALRSVGSVWQYYQLVMTQFPIRSVFGVAGAKPENTFPGAGNERTSFANVTMETFHQDDERQHSCMACHLGAGAVSDFVWSLSDRPNGHVPGDAAVSMLKKSLAQ